MRIRNALLVTLALGACDSRENESVEVSAAQVPLVYKSSISGPGGSGGPSTTPSDAYTAALTRLDQACKQPSRVYHECLGTSKIAIYPDVSSPSTVETIERFGYAATFNRYKEGVNAVRSMFTTRADARAADYYESLSMMNSTLYSRISDGKAAVRERDDLMKKAREVPEKLTQKGEAVRGAEYGRLIRKRQLIRESQTIIERYRTAVDSRQAEYEALATEYKAFHNAEPTVALNALVARASTATVTQLPALQQELLALVNAENETPQDLNLRAARLEGFFESQRYQFDIEIEKYRPFLDEEGVVTPDLTTRPLEILAGMRRYLPDRQQRTNVAAEKLFDGIRRRKAALLLLERDAQTRTTIADASRARAAAEFLDQATAQIQTTWATAPTAAGIELVGPRYQAVLALLQAGVMCNDPDVADWMHDGCGSYAINISKANLYLQSTLPRKLRRDATQLRTAGAATAEVDALDAAVNANDLAKAVMIHDNLAHRLEVTP